MAEVRHNGFAVDQIGTIAGASGGAKWLVLSQLDRVIASRILPKLVGPVHLIGSSIGSWRHACYAQSDPLAAIDRFESAYLDQLGQYAYSLPVCASNQPQISLPPVPCIVASDTLLRRLIPEQEKSPAIPAAQTSGPVVIAAGGGVGGFGVG